MKSEIERFGILALLVVLWAGCSSGRLRRDLYNSGILLYPLAGAGSAVEAAGSTVMHFGRKVYRLATPGGWNLGAKRFDGELTAEQTTGLARFAVPMPSDLGSLTGAEFGLAAGVGSSLVPLQSLQVIVERIAKARFHWYLAPHLLGPVMAFPGGVIALNLKNIGKFSFPEQLFLALHEAGHHYLDHFSDGTIPRRPTQPWANRSKERQADLWACHKMREAGVAPGTIVYAAIQLFDHRPATPIHPSGVERVCYIRAALQQDGIATCELNMDEASALREEQIGRCPTCGGLLSSEDH